MKTLVVCNQKGGVGKTAVATLLAHHHACRGSRVLAIELGCGYVGRSFAGDPKQIVALLEGALAHRGTAFLDIISPYTTFNNHEGSTKSYKHAKETEEMLHEIGFVPYFEPITVEYEEGTSKVVEMHDGSHIVLKKLERDFNPMNKAEALQLIRQSNTQGEFLTGLLYVDPVKPDFTELLGMHDEPLATLPAEKVRLQVWYAIQVKEQIHDYLLEAIRCGLLSNLPSPVRYVPFWMKQNSTR